VRRRQETGVWWASPHVAGVLALMPTVLGIFLIIHELTLHDVLGGVTFPAGGVSFASSLALSKGQLPYDDFVLTQPPGLSILLLPFAWVAHANASAGLDGARGLTAIVSVIDVFLVAFTARFHGISSTFIAGVLFAAFPNAFYATSSVMLEPYVLLFCLLAFQAAFTQGQLAAGGRLVLAGALIGFAVAIKPWALIPAIVLIVCAAVNWRQALGRLLGGLVLGIGVPCITFLLASPGNFMRDVVGAELSRGYAPAVSPPLASRVAEILGLGSTLGISNPNSLAIGVGVVILLVVVVAALVRVSTATPLDWALLATVVGLVVIALVPNQLPIAYTYFLAGFGAIAVGNSVGSLIAVTSTLGSGSGYVSTAAAGGLSVLCVAAMVAVVSVAAPKETDYWRSYFIANASNPSATIDAVVPSGTCVISNNPEALVLAERFATLPAGCPFVADPEGIERVAGSPAAADAAWEQLASEARYVVVGPGQPSLLSSPTLIRFFARQFSLVTDSTYQIYSNNSTLLP